MNDQDRDNRIENLEWVVGGLVTALLLMIDRLMKEETISEDSKRTVINQMDGFINAFFLPWSETTKPNEPIPTNSAGNKVAFHHIPHKQQETTNENMAH